MGLKDCTVLISNKTSTASLLNLFSDVDLDKQKPMELRLESRRFFRLPTQDTVEDHVDFLAQPFVDVCTRDGCLYAILRQHPEALKPWVQGRKDSKPSSAAFAKELHQSKERLYRLGRESRDRRLLFNQGLSQALETLSQREREVRQCEQRYSNGLHNLLSDLNLYSEDMAAIQRCRPGVLSVRELADSCADSMRRLYKDRRRSWPTTLHDQLHEVSLCYSHNLYSFRNNRYRPRNLWLGEDPRAPALQRLKERWKNGNPQDHDLDEQTARNTRHNQEYYPREVHTTFSHTGQSGFGLRPSEDPSSFESSQEESPPPTRRERRALSRNSAPPREKPQEAAARRREQRRSNTPQQSDPLQQHEIPQPPVPPHQSGAPQQYVTRQPHRPLHQSGAPQQYGTPQQFDPLQQYEIHQPPIPPHQSGAPHQSDPLQQYAIPQQYGTPEQYGTRQPFRPTHQSGAHQPSRPPHQSGATQQYEAPKQPRRRVGRSPSPVRERVPRQASTSFTEDSESSSERRPIDE